MHTRQAKLELLMAGPYGNDYGLAFFLDRLDDKGQARLITHPGLFGTTPWLDQGPRAGRCAVRPVQFPANHVLGSRAPGQGTGASPDKQAALTVIAIAPTDKVGLKVHGHGSSPTQAYFGGEVTTWRFCALVTRGCARRHFWDY